MPGCLRGVAGARTHAAAALPPCRWRTIARGIFDGARPARRRARRLLWRARPLLTALPPRAQQPGHH
eukprot:14740111-Alexandrium_andersonii.AAC.1